MHAYFGLNKSVRHMTKMTFHRTGDVNRNIANSDYFKYN